MAGLPDIWRWSDERLDKELMFAKKADDGGAECERWKTALAREAERRRSDQRRSR